MKNYPEPAPGNDSQLNDAAAAADLEFPVNAGFVSRPPALEARIMLQRIAETMPWRSTRPGERERRLVEKISQEFVW